MCGLRQRQQALVLRVKTSGSEPHAVDTLLTVVVTRSSDSHFPVYGIFLPFNGKTRQMDILKWRPLDVHCLWSI